MEDSLGISSNLNIQVLPHSSLSLTSNPASSPKTGTASVDSNHKTEKCLRMLMQFRSVIKKKNIPVAGNSREVEGLVMFLQECDRLDARKQAMLRGSRR